MRVIWKFELDPSGVVEMPRGAEVLTVHEQHGVPMLWALCDPRAPKEQRRFSILPTGEETEAGIPSRFVGTFFLLSSGLVFHVFEGALR